MTEKWNPHVQRRQDLFGFIDILAVDDQPATLAIQACVTKDTNKHLAKLREPKIRVKVETWLRAGNRLSIYGWSLKGQAGARKLYALNETVVTMEMLG